MSDKPKEISEHIKRGLALIVAVGLGTHLVVMWLAPVLPIVFAFAVLGVIITLLMRRH